jgi:cyclophilin family peptidyl-prolyl cis-trans isomerase
VKPSLAAALLGVCLVALPAPGPGQSAAARGKKYALLVGVKSYDHDALPDLKYTENDVEDLARILKRKETGFDPVVVLTTSRGASAKAGKPTAANIRAALKKLLAGVTKYDTVLVALAGHGVQLTVADGKKTRDEAFFCPTDAKLTRSKDLKELSKTLISLKALFDELEDSGAGVKLLLVDACRNDPKLGRNVDVDNVPRPPRGTAALFSCASGQRAFETDKLGKGHGVFFHFVLEGLGGEASNKEGEVTWDDLATYVRRQVTRQVPKIIGEGARQAPHLVSNIVGESPVLVLAPAPAPRADAKRPVVVVKTSLGTITIELDREKAPKTVENFLRYVDDKFYDGTVFHRAIPNFMIQGGGFRKGVGSATTEAEVKAKAKKTRAPIKSEAGNGLLNLRGTIAMARTSDPDSATAQFFINVKDNNFLDPKAGRAGYCVFGTVIAGMDVVDKIKAVKTKDLVAGFRDVPVEDVVIESVRRGKK